MKQYESKLEDVALRLEEIEQELNADIQAPDYSTDSEYSDLSRKITTLQTELDKPVEDTTAEAREKKQSIQSKIEQCNIILSERNRVTDAKARIEELKQQESDLAVQKSRLEGQLFLIEEFIRAKADFLSESINKRFKYVRFKLFDDFITTDGLKECCTVEVNTNGCWVPYNDGNTAGRMNAGIDIINSLIDFYSVSAPIFVDNAEAVTDLIPTSAQVIRLVKPEIATDKDRERYSKLVVEVNG
jgi:exonuclease SbcC